MSDSSHVLDALRCLQDFPVRGTNYLDVSGILRDPVLRSRFVAESCARFPDVDVVVGVEAMGLPAAALVAHELHLPLAIARKGGQIAPDAPVTSASHYRTQSFGVSRAAIHAGQAALIVDDVLATGATFVAVKSSLQQLGARVVGGAYLVDHLGWRKLPELAETPRYTMLEISAEQIAKLPWCPNPRAFSPGMRGRMENIASRSLQRARDAVTRLRSGRS